MTMDGATLRVEYLAALGLEPLLLRAPFAAAGDAATDAHADARGSDASGVARGSDRAGSTGESGSAPDPASTSTSARQPGRALSRDKDSTETTGTRASRSAAAKAVSDDAGLFAPRPARLCFLLPDDDGLDGPNARLLRAIAHAAGVSPAELASVPTDGVPVMAFATVPPSDLAARAPSPSALRSAQQKRALWPILRRLRRALRSSS